MPILQPNEPTVERYVERHKEDVRAFVERTVADFLTLGGGVLSPPEPYTAEQVVAAYGAEAAELLSLYATLSAGLSAIKGRPITAIPEGWTLAANADGTGTVTRPAPPPGVALGFVVSPGSDKTTVTIETTDGTN